MILETSTPALLFPAISLLFLAYTNRFLHLANLVRKLHCDWVSHHDDSVMIQIDNIRTRLKLIRWMQLLGAISLLLCTISMMSILLKCHTLALSFFSAAILLMTGSLVILIREVINSGGALQILLTRVEEHDSQQST